MLRNSRLSRLPDCSSIKVLIQSCVNYVSGSQQKQWHMCAFHDESCVRPGDEARVPPPPSLKKTLNGQLFSPLDFLPTWLSPHLTHFLNEAQSECHCVAYRPAFFRRWMLICILGRCFSIVGQAWASSTLCCFMSWYTSHAEWSVGTATMTTHAWTKLPTQIMS